MEDIKIRVSDLKALFNIGKKLSLIDLRHTASTVNSLHAEFCFSKIVKQCQSILRLVYKDLKRSEIYDSFDVSSIASIARDIIEAYNVFYYLCFEKVKPAEKEFRNELFNLHQCKEATEVAKGLGIHSGFTLNVKNIFQMRTETILKNNSVFTALTLKQQKSLLKGKHIVFHLNESKKGAAYIQRHGALYKLFSNNVHSSHLGIEHTAEGLFSGKILFMFSIESSIIYLSRSIWHYSRLRRKICSLLSNDEKQFIGSHKDETNLNTIIDKIAQEQSQNVFNYSKFT